MKYARLVWIFKYFSILNIKRYLHDLFLFKKNCYVKASEHCPKAQIESAAFATARCTFIVNTQSYGYSDWKSVHRKEKGRVCQIRQFLDGRWSVVLEAEARWWKPCRRIIGWYGIWVLELSPACVHAFNTSLHHMWVYTYAGCFLLIVVLCVVLG